MGPHHLQTTHPLPKTKQGRRRFFPLGLKSLPPKSVNKIRLQYNKFQILKLCTPFILWPFDYLHLYLSTISMGCLFSTSTPASSLLSVRQVCIDNSWSILGGYLPQNVWDQGRDIWNIWDWSLSKYPTKIWRPNTSQKEMLSMKRKRRYSAMCAQSPLL